MEYSAQPAEFPVALKHIEFRVTRQAIQRYAEISRDFNPIHLDDAFAAATPMGGVIAHGTMSLNLIWQSLTATFGPASARGARLNARFVQPVRIGDELRVGSAHRMSAPGTYDVWVANTSGVKVIDGQLSLPSAPSLNPGSST